MTPRATGRIEPLGDALVHLRLLGQMGRTTGADLPEAFARGLIGSADWAGMVTACRGCRIAGQCRDWLDANETAADAPEGCCNRERLQDLRAELSKGRRK